MNLQPSGDLMNKILSTFRWRKYCREAYKAIIDIILDPDVTCPVSVISGTFFAHIEVRGEPLHGSLIMRRRLWRAVQRRRADDLIRRVKQ